MCEYVRNALYWNHGVAPFYPRPYLSLLAALLGSVQSLFLCCHLSSVWISNSCKVSEEINTKNTGKFQNFLMGNKTQESFSFYFISVPE